MLKKAALVVLLIVVGVGFSGCGYGGNSIFHRGWRHVEWHLLGAYKDLINLHKDIDRYVFNLDERNPDRY